MAKKIFLVLNTRSERNESTTKSTKEPGMKADYDNSEIIGLCHVGMYARNPASLASARAVEKIIEFVHEQVR